MAWEGARGGSAQRIEWAQLVLLHRVLPRDPLAASELPRDWSASSPDAPVALMA
jgi:acyl-CoA dehydrogenase